MRFCRVPFHTGSPSLLYSLFLTPIFRRRTTSFRFGCARFCFFFKASDSSPMAVSPPPRLSSSASFWARLFSSHVHFYIPSKYGQYARAARIFLRFFTRLLFRQSGFFTHPTPPWYTLPSRSVKHRFFFVSPDFSYTRLLALCRLQLHSFPARRAPGRLYGTLSSSCFGWFLQPPLLFQF